MSIKGNHKLMVNPILIPVLRREPRVRNSESQYGASADIAWGNAVSAWNATSWMTSFNKGVMCYQFIYYLDEDPDRYEAMIFGNQVKVKVNLTAYDPDEYESANLVVMPINPSQWPSFTYYCGRGWLENEYNFVQDVKSELGTIWTSAMRYPSNCIYSKPQIPTIKGTYCEKGYKVEPESEHGFFVHLIPKT